MTTKTIVSTPREQAIADVFCTACEGGIGYWAQFQTYRWSDGTPQMNQINEFEAKIKVAEGDDPDKVYVIDARVIRKGIRKAYEAFKTTKGYQGDAIRALNWGKWDDLDFDADTADIIVQYGLFDEVVYG